MDRLTSMAVFVRAVEAGSFAAAAETLGLSAPMVGKHIRFLEDRLGARLLARTTRRQSLTEVGRAFYDSCRVVLAEAEAAEALAADLRAVPRGRLRVNAPVTFGAHELMPMVARYLRVHPEVSIEVTLSDRIVDLVEEGYEAVIRIAPLSDSSLVARRLRPYRLVVCAAPAYLAERGVPARPADLASHECLGFVHWAPRDLWPFIDAAGRAHSVRVRGRVSVDSGQALRTAALEGLGLILQPEGLLRDDIAAGRLVRVLPGYDPPSRPMHILFAPDRRPTPKLRSFIDAVVEAFG
jgi:DNA-binding transcriptional LysR family regulator